MKILVDMNLSPDWVEVLRQAGHDAVHWSSCGAVDASDETILRLARDNGQLLFTHDLDFAALLAIARAVGPSVLQIRTHDVLPDAIAGLVLAVMRDHAVAIEQGALVSVDEASARVRILPIK
jgi:predicted nuclease of predicted toxin-antitoxin system